jgi:hypothetical protein
MTLLSTQTTDSGIVREIYLSAAWDKRSPEPSKNYGIHGCEWVFVVRRNDCAISWRVMSTDWYLPHVRKELEAKRSSPMHLPDGLGDLGYHSHKPTYPEQMSMHKCDWLGGKPCYYDGSGLQSNELFDRVVADPTLLWQELESRLEKLERQVADQITDERNFS